MPRHKTKLAEYLATSKTKQADFARQAGIARMVLWHYVRGDRRPGLRNALAIAEASGGRVPADYWPTFEPLKARRSRRSSRRN